MLVEIVVLLRCMLAVAVKAFLAFLATVLVLALVLAI